MNESLIKRAANKIVLLYNSADGGVGGYGHIVFDDDNVETHHVKWCLDQANELKYKDWLSEECRLLSMDALKSLLPLTESQRLKAIKLSEDIRYRK